MATETWMLNETLTISGSNVYNNIEMTYSGQQRAYPIKSLKIYEYIDGRETAYSVLGQEQSVYSDENTSYELYGTGGGASGWFSYNGTLYNTWKFSQPVTDSTLLTWLQANGTKQASTPKVTVDLTSLSGYESLAAGTYQLGVKAKAANYQDSDLSQTVSFTKLAAPVATAADTTVTWDAITNAESYDVYVDGELYENTTGGVTYNITTTVTNGTYSGDMTISDTATVTITADSGYTLPDTVTVTGASQTWNKETGTLTLTNPTGAVTVSAVCVAAVKKTVNITLRANASNKMIFYIIEDSGEPRTINTSTLTATHITGDKYNCNTQYSLSASAYSTISIKHTSSSPDYVDSLAMEESDCLEYVNSVDSGNYTIKKYTITKDGTALFYIWYV